MKDTKDFIPVINFLRGIASLSVCAVHTYYITNLSKFPQFKFLSAGQDGVAAFLVISGFIIPYSLWNSNYEIKNFFSYVLKRSLRIDPPYFVMILLSIISLQQLDILKLLSHITYFVPFTTYLWYQSIFWTLGIEFQFYLIIGLLFPVFKSGNIKIVLTIILLIAAGGYFIEVPRSHYFITHNAHFFAYGLITLLAKKNKISVITWHILILSLTLYLALTISIHTAILGYITSLVIFYLNFQFSITNFLGRISYSLYLVHMFFGALLFEYLRRYHIPIPALFLIIMVWCILVAYIFYILIEKPALKLSKSIRFLHK
ncbi:acyltransferase family protein [Pedobacter sp. LMG 31464]|uniref:Acyltransferase family protein n=1 Tax=Pedobacter planticolens TaxID=2679964 RepID=A0A923DUH3_9SPHI|nr:acyltransferase [Pedobacter planticolens]MBB2144096.1 acyltransferase family protein [Pedobacter planticolens]